MMHTPTVSFGRNPLATLQHFVRRDSDRTEVCELCAKEIPSAHPHLFELERRRVRCTCEACSILFGDSTRHRYRRIPRDVEFLQDFRMDNHEWESLLIPINLAFFVHNSQAGRVVAQYPSPGGVMESSLDLEYWDAIAARNPVLKKLTPDVEALLVSRIGSPAEYFRVPIDRCLHLVGLIRTHWHGLSGGDHVWKQIDDFFDQLRAQSGS